MAENPRIEDLRRRLEKEPGSRVFAQLAEELRKAGQLPEAIRVARQGLLAHPAYPTARMTLGRALLDNRDLRGARIEFEAVLRGAPDNILASRFLAECLEGLGDLGSALLQYRAAQRMTPGDRHIETRIQALQDRLSPMGPSASGRTRVPREGVPIPVVEVDGPMEMAGSFPEKVRGNNPEGPPAAPAPPPEFDPPTAPPSLDLPPEPDPEPHEVAQVEEAQPEVKWDEEAVGSTTLEVQPHVPTVEAAPPEELNESFPEDWVAEERPRADAPALASSTLAELYFNQGFTAQAIDVYRELLQREPGNERYRARMAEIETLTSDAGDVGPGEAPADPGSGRREVIERTIARLEGMLGTFRRI